MVGGKLPTTLYLVVPPSDINRTKPLIRLILNQVGRRLTEDLQAKAGRHRLLLMLDEFPRSAASILRVALAFMAGYGLKSFLIAQSLNQIEKAYGPNNSILDNCHVRVSFATNDERTAKRLRCARHRDRDEGDEELCRHRLSPWLGHLMVSRSETAPAADARRDHAAPADRRDRHGRRHAADPAKKARYYEDARFRNASCRRRGWRGRRRSADDWSTLPIRAPGHAESRRRRAATRMTHRIRASASARTQPGEAGRKEGADRQRVRDRFA
jgi:type IV secretion system protein VirD4